jgi:hypothetical protein
MSCFPVGIERFPVGVLLIPLHYHLLPVLGLVEQPDGWKHFCFGLAIGTVYEFRLMLSLYITKN